MFHRSLPFRVSRYGVNPSILMLSHLLSGRLPTVLPTWGFTVMSRFSVSCYHDIRASGSKHRLVRPAYPTRNFALGFLMPWTISSPRHTTGARRLVSGGSIVNIRTSLLIALAKGFTAYSHVLTDSASPQNEAAFAYYRSYNSPSPRPLLPNEEASDLRTVIVTAGVHPRFSRKLRTRRR